MGIFDGDPNKSHSPFERPHRTASGGAWGQGSDATDPVIFASTSSDDNVINDGFPKLGACLRAIRQLEEMSLLLQVLEEQADTFCGEGGAEDLCAITRMNLGIARSAINAAQADIQRACVKAV